MDLTPPDVSLVLGLTVVAAAGAWFGLRALERRRAAGLRRLAQRKAFGYVPTPESFVVTDLQFSMPGTGSVTGVSHVLRGFAGEHALLVCDCTFHHPRTEWRPEGELVTTVCVVTTPGMRLPPFLLRGRGTLEDPNPGPGETRLEFADDHAFSGGLWLRGVDGEALRGLFSATVRQQLLEYADSELVVQGEGERLLVHFRAVLSVSKVEGLITQALALRRLLVAAR